MHRSRHAAARVLARYCPAAVLGAAGWVWGATPEAQVSGASGGQPDFPILEIRVLHSTILSTRQVERAVYPHLGEHRTLADVQAARADLEKAYHEAGYSAVFVDIPEQSVEDGIVRLAVTEGHLDRVRVTGTRYFSNRRILAAVPSLKSGDIPHFPEVQSELAELNRASADLQVAPIIKAGRDPGTVDAELKVKDTLPLHADVEVADRGTPNTTRTRLNVSLSYTNLFQSFHSISFQYQVAPARSKDAKVYALGYLAPLGSGGASLALSAVQTDSDVATFGTLGVLGKGHIYGLHYSTPLGTLGGFHPSLTFGADFKQFDQSILLSGAPGLRTPVRYVNWSAALAAGRFTERATTTLDMTAAFGITGIVNTAAEFENNRYLAKSDYLYVRFDASHEQRLWRGSAAVVRLSGQFSPDPLISNEQFVIGGSSTVRGYLEAEELGDMGSAASFELHSPSLFGGRPQRGYLYLFYDGGITEIISPLPKQVRHEHLASWGAGVRIIGYHGLDASFDWALPQVTTVNTKSGQGRADFRVHYGF